MFGTTLHSNHNSECKRQDRLKRRTRTRKLNEHTQAKIQQRQTRMKTPSGSAWPLLLQRSCWLLPFCISSLNVFHLYLKPNNFPNLYPNVFLYKLDWNIFYQRHYVKGQTFEAAAFNHWCSYMIFQNVATSVILFLSNYITASCHMQLASVAREVPET